jgi:hypothetical protein
MSEDRLQYPQRQYVRTGVLPHKSDRYIQTPLKPRQPVITQAAMCPIICLASSQRGAVFLLHFANAASGCPELTLISSRSRTAAGFFVNLKLGPCNVALHKKEREINRFFSHIPRTHYATQISGE